MILMKHYLRCLLKLKELNRYTQQSEISPLTEDKADSLEPHNATSVLEDIAGFFKGLMQKFKLIRQSSDSNVNDNSSGKSETKES